MWPKLSVTANNGEVERREIAIYNLSFVSAIYKFVAKSSPCKDRVMDLFRGNVRRKRVAFLSEPVRRQCVHVKLLQSTLS